MKKFSLLCVAIILGGAACIPGRKKTAKEDRRKEQAPKELVSAVAMADKNAYYDENVGAFVFEQDMNDNAFDGATATTIAQTEVTTYEMTQEKPAHQFKSVYYDFNKYGIRNDQKEVFAYDTELVKDAINQGATVVFEGHADHAAGSPEYNLLLSNKRAEHAAEVAAKEFGVDRTAIKVVGRGDTMPKVFGGDRDQQAPNRRLEIYELGVAG